MHLPSRLRSTTLGDLLGSLHRERAHGTLELVEDRGRAHRIYLSQGLVVAVELDGSSESLGEILKRDQAADDDVLRRSLLRAIATRRLHGEVLVDEYHLSPALLGRALRRQMCARLEAIEALPDARVVFHVAVRPPRWALQAAPLDAREFLYGRRRAREREEVESPYPCPRTADRGAWRVLGVKPGTDVAGIKRAYRHLARSFHPDLHPQATDEQRRALQASFVQVTEAYRVLVA